jgi:tRNA threonylcarbamoyladenosine biosynthesis protein TsaB
MILTIDTTIREDIVVGLSDSDTLNCFQFETDDQSADLLPAVENVLKNQKLTLKDIKIILVNQGPGSFTGVRVGITVANALAWSLDIPVWGFTTENLEKTLVKTSKTKEKKFSKVVLPYYLSKK